MIDAVNRGERANLHDVFFAYPDAAVPEPVLRMHREYALIWFLEDCGCFAGSARKDNEPTEAGSCPTDHAVDPPPTVPDCDDSSTWAAPC